MTFAYASPPPFRLGSADLKSNARKFLERALLISALVHLSATGVFRAAEERMAAREEGENPRAPTWKRPVFLAPPMLPTPWNWRPVSAPSNKGVFDPVERDVPFPTIDPGTVFRPQSQGVEGEPREGPGGPTGPGKGPPPEEPMPAFTYAETPPVPIDALKPPYPEWAREAGIEGKVLLRVLVGADGLPKNVIVASGPKGLRDEARAAVMLWKFRPGLSNGTPVEVWVEVPVTYSLSGS